MRSTLKGLVAMALFLALGSMIDLGSAAQPAVPKGKANAKSGAPVTGGASQKKPNPHNGGTMKPMGGGPRQHRRG